MCLDTRNIYIVIGPIDRAIKMPNEQARTWQKHTRQQFKADNDIIGKPTRAESKMEVAR